MKAYNREATKTLRIPVSRVAEIEEYLRTVPADKADEVMEMIAKHLGIPRQRKPVQLTLVKNDDVIPVEPTGQLSLIENVQLVKLESELKEKDAELETVEAKAGELQSELETCKRSLESAEAKLNGLTAVLATFKTKLHPTSPRWEHARKLLAELESVLLYDGEDVAL
ncbi:hypothetical protein [Beggiatoa leptomitoformis]|uniref:Uncharacterized protein n=1 Tax=Beggiatoa leptomitoformis TaxID=288004 RepID=A0A2N9YBN3_9GAMM|nr:hypothetical protein [Beggiatoa leptomitoformis]ALG66768.1 hypothetical protein AL038_02375 [Beggiatoa leptomitoformis]AUI67887.1 hypothetical protein BLE401_03665 [Beggiatoa leptomitoformis]